MYSECTYYMLWMRVASQFICNAFHWHFFCVHANLLSETSDEYPIKNNKRIGHKDFFQESHSWHVNQLTWNALNLHIVFVHVNLWRDTLDHYYIINKQDIKILKTIHHMVGNLSPNPNQKFTGCGQKST